MSCSFRNTAKVGQQQGLGADQPDRCAHQPGSIHPASTTTAEPSNTYDLTGTIGAGETYVVVSPDADPAWQAYADALSQVTWFSGNDPVALLKNGVYIDIMGELGYDSTTPIAVTGGSMELHTLRRKLEVTSPTTDWTVGQGQWDVYDANVVDGLGSHLWVPCDNNNEPQVTFETTTQRRRRSGRDFGIGHKRVGIHRRGG